MKNNTLLEISEKLLQAKSILLFPHLKMDGDTLGSCVALCSSLRKKGKETYILLEDRIPDNLLFLAGDYCTNDREIIGCPDLCVSVDCSDPGRFEKRGEIFLSGGCQICIDHHATTDFYGDLNYIDGKAAATGEIIYELLLLLGASLDKQIANALFAAITTDTGNFCYSNTTKHTHEIVAALYDFGLDNCYVCNEIYDNLRTEQLAIQALAVAAMETFADGKANLTCISGTMLAQVGADMAETEGVVEKLRSIRGIEISALLKEESPSVVKVSLRAKSYSDVAVIAQMFGGGGHKKAAGCTIRKPLGEAKENMIAAITAQLEKESQCEKKG